jgi:hypothetical protein
VAGKGLPSSRNRPERGREGAAQQSEPAAARTGAAAPVVVVAERTGIPKLRCLSLVRPDGRRLAALVVHRAMPFSTVSAPRSMAGASRITITALAASAPGSSVRAVAGAEAAECHAADVEWALADVGEGDDQVRRDTEFDLAEVGRAAERQDSRRSGHRDGAGTARIVAVDGDGRRLAAVGDRGEAERDLGCRVWSDPDRQRVDVRDDELRRRRGDRGDRQLALPTVAHGELLCHASRRRRHVRTSRRRAGRASAVAVGGRPHRVPFRQRPDLLGVRPHHAAEPSPWRHCRVIRRAAATSEVAGLGMFGVIDRH